MKIKVSYATAVKLGIKKAKLEYPLPLAYLMVGSGKCKFDCSYCSQAKSSKSNPLNLSRIKWPELDYEDFLNRFKEVNFFGVCIQTINSTNMENILLKIVYDLKKLGKIVYVSLRPEDKELPKILLSKFKIDNLGIPIDVANEKLYDEIRGDDYHKLLDIMFYLSELHPNKITTHLIVGLGESDKDLIEKMILFREKGINVSLFAFTPVKGTKMEKFSPPDLKRYRRIQYAREMIFNSEVTFEDFVFSYSGELKKLPNIDIDENEAIKTSGCPLCTRPYYNERPGKELFNVPLPRKIEKIMKRRDTREDEAFNF